jgi:hypothetical protein
MSWSLPLVCLKPQVHSIPVWMGITCSAESFWGPWNCKAYPETKSSICAGARECCQSQGHIQGAGEILKPREVFRLARNQGVPQKPAPETRECPGARECLHVPNMLIAILWPIFGCSRDLQMIPRTSHYMFSRELLGPMEL